MGCYLDGFAYFGGNAADIGHPWSPAKKKKGRPSVNNPSSSPLPRRCRKRFRKQGRHRRRCRQGSGEDSVGRGLCNYHHGEDALLMRKLVPFTRDCPSVC